MLTVMVFCVCAVICAKADTASRLYEQGKYKEAFELYKKAAANQKDNWPLFYDLGVAAYKSGRPDEAVKAFERAVSSIDKPLQAKSLYNLGNSYFRIGEMAEQQKPDQALPIYERSLKSYEGSVALDPNDVDAKHNIDVVKKKIEELKKKQEQQQKQQNKQQDNKDQNKDKDKDKEKQDQNQQQGQQNNQQQQSQKPDEKQKQDQQNQQQLQKPQDQQQANQNKADEKQNPQPQPGQTNNIEQMQAQILLDNLREEEKNWNFFPELQMNLKDTGEPAKDW